MPLYDYDCAACGTRFEVVHGLHADPPTTCPVCGGGPIKKAFAPPAIHFKGSGWAKKERRATAARGSSKPASAEGGSTSKTGSESSGTTGTATATDGASSSASTSSSSSSSASD